MENSSKDTGKIARSAGSVSVAVMCSRVLGLIREQAFAALFGAGFAYDSFVVAFRIPNLLRDLFAEGALSSAFIAVFTDYDRNRSREETWNLAANVFVFFGILLSLITLIGILWAHPLVRLLAPDFILVPGKAELTGRLTMIMFPFLIFISLAAVAMGVLNSKGRFFVPAMASSYFNLGSIIGGVSLAFILPRFGQPAIVGMAIGTLIGGVLQLGCQIPSLLKAGFTLRWRLDLQDQGLRRVLKLMVPAIIGLSATQINIFINTNFASSCVEGSVSWLNYSFRLVQLPIGLFGVAVSIASLPVLAGYAAVRDIKGLKETYVSSLLIALCLTLPATVGLVMLANPIVKIIFEHGNFTALDTVRTAEALSFYALGLFAYGAVKIIVPVFYTLNDTKWPVAASFLAVAGNIVIILLTIDRFQHQAIALSTSCTMILNFLFLSTVLYRKVGGYSLSYLCNGIGRIILASLVMGLFIFVLDKWLGNDTGLGFMAEVTLLAILIGGGGLAYGLTLYALGLKELRTVVDRVRARFGRKT